jgi:hypothetical protein
MRFSVLLLLALMSSARLDAQDAQPSAGGAAPSSSELPATSTTSSQLDAEATGALPVSLDRIREALSRTPQMTGLRKLDIKPDFSVRVQEREHIRAILSTLDVKSGPSPAGGLYAYEQQQQIWNKVDRPLAQPYAAFSPGELITLAIEGLMQKYLVGAILGGISNLERESAERAAKEDVARAIAEYCVSHPEARHSLQLCSSDSLSR